MKKSSQADFGTGSIGKLLFSMAVPAITAQIINLLYNIVDRMYIGHIPVIGATALTGVGRDFSDYYTDHRFQFPDRHGRRGAGRNFYGRRDNNMAEEILGNCCAALLCISVVLTTVILLFCEPLLMAFGASADTIG